MAHNGLPATALLGWAQHLRTFPYQAMEVVWQRGEPMADEALAQLIEERTRTYKPKALMQPGELYPWMAQHGLSVLQVGAYTNHALMAHLYARGTLDELTQWWPEEQQLSPQQFLQVFRTHGYYGDEVQLEARFEP